MFGLTGEDIHLIVQAIAKHSDVEEAVVFGSRAMGNYKPGSDVDIALKGALQSDTCSDVFAELNEHLPLLYKFDVVEYSQIQESALRKHIDHYGKVLYKRT
jgi:predicted nucleotidyltransferase